MRAVHFFLMLAAACGATSTRPRSESAAPRNDRAADRDGDFILDRCDACPDAPESYDQDEDADGCPEAVTVHGSHHPVAETIYFAADEATVGVASAPVLDALAAGVRAPEVEIVFCIGQAGARERDRPLLARRRAEAVRDALVSRGVPANRFELHVAEQDAWGQAQPDDERAQQVFVAVARESAEHWYQTSRVHLRWTGTALETLRPGPQPSAPQGPATCPVR